MTTETSLFFSVSLVSLVSLAGCSKTAEPASIDAFVPPVGQVVPAGCTKDADGKRLAMTGHLALQSSATIDKGRVPLTLCKDVDPGGACKGRGAQVSVTSPGDIDDLWSEAKKVKTTAYKTKEGTIDPSALRIHAKNGEATTNDLLDVVVVVKTTLHFQTKEVTACDLEMVSATKK